MKTRIDACFARLAARKEKAFIGYLTAGDPSLSATEDAVLRLGEVGVDIVELGIPFSDPLADGRVNQESAARALGAGATLERVLETVRRIRRRSEIPLLCYTYMNPLHALGMERVLGAAADAGVDGFLCLDLPVEEGASCRALLRRFGLNNIALVTPTTPPERIARIARAATGFVYCVSREGVTGMQQRLSAGAGSVVQATQKATRLPVAIGFGISTPEQAAAAARDADAVVVGSAIVNRFHTAPHTPKGRREAAAWVGTLVQAVKGVH